MGVTGSYQGALMCELYFYPGGCAIVSSVGETETRMSIQNNFKLLNDILEKCVSDNIITKTEKENTTYAACFRRQDEIKEPFVNSNVLTDLGLHLHQVKQELVPCFYTAEWKQRLDTGDRDIILSYLLPIATSYRHVLWSHPLKGLIPEPRSYCLDYDNVYVTASGTDFYKQCVPSNTFDLLMSFTAVHFLSR
ncbi:hypothetical protein LOTGIDRAFT_155360 [Lottia gigantea]|uniref:Uncharacterized protein n=1 Tax=Lottia gigantea TaxID=225164 RepID=V3ZT23_LOTGI|nr:hypothetical protein LOTGIDRAFT_155360 [Lottia gigantea]ESO84046.1 hypothetical protein LOTGIDRAFT_155360 [Lottia gigantea]